MADYPWVYKCFTDHGLHTIRRSDRFWAGLLKDLIIEQVMMRSLKSRGGLTRGALLGVSMCHHKLDMSQSYRVGWKVENGVLVPVKIDIAAATEFVLNVIRCSCKTPSKNMCGTKLCSCRKNGLACVAAGNDCRGHLATLFQKTNQSLSWMMTLSIISKYSLTFYIFGDIITSNSVEE